MVLIAPVPRHCLPSTLLMTLLIIEPRSEKTGLRGFRQGPTQTGYREADLRLCFRICKKPVFS